MTYCPENDTESATGRRFEITEEMIEAGDRALGESGVCYNDELTHRECVQAVRDIYLAMVALSPRSDSGDR